MKDKIFIFCITYFLIVAAFITSIEIIIATNKNYFNFLYYESGGYADKIFLGWCIIGIFSLCIYLMTIKKRRLGKNNLKLDK